MRCTDEQTRFPRGEASMIGAPATLIGMAGTAVLLASLAPAAVGHPSTRPDATVAVADSLKGDRIATPVAAKTRASVSSVELVGISNATVILRDRSGAILFRSDPLTNTTLVTKDADLPVVTLKEQGTSPVVQQPIPSREGSETPQPPQGRTTPPGCEAPLSPLASRSLTNRIPGLCLVGLEVNPVL
jgi:hypothetical protein